MSNMELQEARDVLRRHRVRNNFDKTYRAKGGVMQLLRMVESHDTTAEMSKWFGLSQSRLSVILPDILGTPYSQYLASKNITRSGIKEHHEAILDHGEGQEAWETP